MKLLPALFKMISLVSISALFPAVTFAHETDTVHKEVPASVDPMLALGVVVIVAIGGIIIWKVMFSKKTEPPKVVQDSTQPEKLEDKK